MHLRFWQPRRRHAVMYHVTVWLLQPTCHLPRWGSWSRGSFSYSAGNTHHLNLFWQVTHRLKQHNSCSLAAMEVKEELPSKWRKTGFVVAIVSTEKQSRWFSHPPAGPRQVPRRVWAKAGKQQVQNTALASYWPGRGLPSLWIFF